MSLNKYAIVFGIALVLATQANASGAWIEPMDQTKFLIDGSVRSFGQDNSIAGTAPTGENAYFSQIIYPLFDGKDWYIPSTLIIENASANTGKPPGGKLIMEVGNKTTWIFQSNHPLVIE